MRHIESPQRRMSQEMEITGFGNEAIQRSYNAVKPKKHTQSKHSNLFECIFIFYYNYG